MADTSPDPLSRDKRRREGHLTNLSATVKEAVADAEGKISQEEATEARPRAARPRTREDCRAEQLDFRQWPTDV